MRSPAEALAGLTRFNPTMGTMSEGAVVQRYLTDLRGLFRDSQAFERTLARGNPLVYAVTAVEPATGDGDLHYGLVVVYPGLVGDEYFLTKGHLHTWRDAAEVYIGLAGEGTMLLEDERTGHSRILPLQANGIVYVPGHTAHRTINTSDVPLVYLGVYPARAGHDYDSMMRRNFRYVVVKRDGQPCMLPRENA